MADGLSFLYPTQDNVIGASLRTHGGFAKPESDLITDYLRRQPAAGSFLDIGANIGAICLPVARANPAWRIMAVEAHRGLHGILSANALNNRLLNVEAHHAAAGPAAGLVEFPATPLDSTGNFGSLGLHLTDTPTETVRMLTLDAFAPGDTEFIKMDVEGFEPEVLKGADHVIRNLRPAWFFEANPGTDAPSRQAMKVFDAAGYRLFWFFAPFTTGGGAKAKQSIRGDTNVLALPDNMPNRWNLTAVESLESQRPGNLDGYAYLNRYFD